MLQNLDRNQNIVIVSYGVIVTLYSFSCFMQILPHKDLISLKTEIYKNAVHKKFVVKLKNNLRTDLGSELSK